MIWMLTQLVGNVTFLHACVKGKVTALGQIISMTHEVWGPLEPRSTNQLAHLWVARTQ